jgi:hypothetical protein
MTSARAMAGLLLLVVAALPFVPMGGMRSDIVFVVVPIFIWSCRVAWSTEMGYVIAFALFIVLMFIRPGGILARRQ